MISFAELPSTLDMKPLIEPRPEAPKPKPSRLEEARARAIEEYMNDLQEFMRSFVSASVEAANAGFSATKRWPLPIPHHRRRRLIPIEIRPHICATLAAGLADETRLQIGQPQIIRPGIAADRD